MTKAQVGSPYRMFIPCLHTKDCAFTAAKAAAFNLTRIMALELAPYNIRVNGITPGSIMYEGVKELYYNDKQKSAAIMSRFPVVHPGEPDDIAAATCYLASEDAKFMTGSIMTIDGGWICGYNRELWGRSSAWRFGKGE